MSRQDIALQITLAAIQSGLIKNALSINNSTTEENNKITEGIAENLVTFFNKIVKEVDIKS